MSKKPEDFEKQLKRLQAVVAQLEAGDLPLEKGMALYKEGLALSRSCRERLEAARNQITLAAADGELEFENLEDANGPDAG